MNSAKNNLILKKKTYGRLLIWLKLLKMMDANEQMVEKKL